MWIFLRNAFVSVVQDRADAKRLLIRARCREHLETVAGGATILETPERDYRYRCSVERDEFADLIREHVHDIAYPNFKDNIPDPNYRWAATNVWQERRRLQEEQ